MSPVSVKHDMLPCRDLFLAICLLTAGFAPAAAQRGGRLDCPKPVRERAYRKPLHIILEISAGLTKPVLYHNSAGSLDGPFRFNSLPSPYAGVTGYVALSDRLSAFAGLTLTQSWQGISASDGEGFHMKSYAGSLLLSLPAGIYYRLSPALGISAAPYITYSSHWEYGNAEGSAANPYYTYEAPADKARLIPGLRLAAELSITRRFGAVLSCAADAGQSTASAAALNTGAHTSRAALRPYLLHPGLGLTYKFGQREE